MTNVRGKPCDCVSPHHVEEVRQAADEFRKLAETAVKNYLDEAYKVLGSSVGRLTPSHEILSQTQLDELAQLKADIEAAAVGKARVVRAGADRIAAELYRWHARHAEEHHTSGDK